MPSARNALLDYAAEVIPLAASSTTTEATYYPAVRSLLAAVLSNLGLPSDVRANTSEHRHGGGVDLPDFALYDGAGDFVLVYGEVKNPPVELVDIASSTERSNQIGRYLVHTRVVIICNIRDFGIVTVDPQFQGRGAIPPDRRRFELSVSLWPSAEALAHGVPVNPDALDALSDLVETAITRYAPIAEPETLARVLARQARRAKAGLPERFSSAVSTLAEDFGAALGITFEGEEGEEFFRSSLVQTVFYGLFAGWMLWSRTRDPRLFNWRELPQYLRIPFLGELLYEIQHPRRIAELGIAQHLDLASETLTRANRDIFFSRLRTPTLAVGEDAERAAVSAIVYFYEPFLETFDPALRKELGVWYTPPEIVRYQVRKVDRLLRTELGCERGFADERVIVLDPACGTGAYLIEVLQCMAETLRGEGVEAELGDTLLRAVVERVFGFEILTAPFVISHLQLFLILSSLGAEPTADQRPGVFLTNSLTGWTVEPQIALHFPELQEERDAAHRVKTDARIIVILGNPPYNRFAGAAVDEEMTLVDPYKGIRRNAKGRQIGTSELYRRWRIRKQLLDELYIRFFRLAEERIGQRAEHGVVSIISNSSYLAGRSHPLMREAVLTAFQEVWIDNLHGNRLASERTPWGESCETMFSTESGAGIKVGTAISTFVKRNRSAHQPQETPIWVRDFWGRASAKRASLMASLEMEQWQPGCLEEAARLPQGPRQYERFFSSEDRRWKFLPYEAVGGYDDWFSLEDMFPVVFQGINPNRGLQGSLIDTDRASLEQRMREYYSEMPYDEFSKHHPILCSDYARYAPADVRGRLQRDSSFQTTRIVPYVIFPFDARFLYYETQGKLLNECRAELWENLPSNEFLIAVPSRVGPPRRGRCSRREPSICIFTIEAQ